MTIYFISEKGSTTAPVKIGRTASLEARLKTLQTAHAADLDVIASCPGDRAEEAAFHAELAADHIRGEWYRRSARLDAVVSRLAASVPAIVEALPRKRSWHAQLIENAKQICRSVHRQELPDASTAEAIRWICEQIADGSNDRGERITESRVRTFYFGEARRIDNLEFNALTDLQERCAQAAQDRLVVENSDAVAQYLAAEGAPLNATQLAIVQRLLGDAAARLSGVAE